MIQPELDGPIKHSTRTMLGPHITDLLIRHELSRFFPCFILDIHYHGNTMTIVMTKSNAYRRIIRFLTVYFHHSFFFSLLLLWFSFFFFFCVTESVQRLGSSRSCFDSCRFDTSGTFIRKWFSNEAWFFSFSISSYSRTHPIRFGKQVNTKVRTNWDIPEFGHENGCINVRGFCVR